MYFPGVSLFSDILEPTPLATARKGLANHMKAVAAALVLIAGAAVILWFGNTLNSWVLGGLIGGLAALLLSIPISLIIFSYLSRRHEEQEHLHAEVYEEDTFFEDDGYVRPRLASRQMKRVYEVESYTLPAPSAMNEAEVMQRQRSTRQLPAPTSQRLPIAKNTRATSTSLQRVPPQEATRNVPSNPPAEGRTTSMRRPLYPGFPGYEPGSPQSRHRSQALRAARIEAFQQVDEDEEDEELDFSPTQQPRRSTTSSLRASQALSSQQERNVEPTRRSLQQLTNQQQTRNNHQVGDPHSSRGANQRALPAAGESSASTRRTSAQLRRRRTDFLEQGEEMETTNERQTRQTRLEGGKSAGKPTRELPRSENFNRPLVRRAPYMYDDDPLREELTRQLEQPTKRRSSLYEPEDIDDEEDEF